MKREWDTIVDGSFIIIAVVLYSINETLIKKTGIQLSGVLFISNLVSALCGLAYWYIRDPMPGLKLFGDSKREKWTLFFFFLVQTTIFFFYYALIRLPLGDLSCIQYQAPLWIVLLSWFLFNDQMTPWYIFIPAAILVISGVILVAQPTFIFHSAAWPLPADGVIAAFFAAARWIAMVMIIKMGGNTLHTVQYQLVSNIACLTISVPVLLIVNSVLFQNEQLGTFSDFCAMPWTDWLVALFVGFSYFIGMIVDMMAYQRGNVAMIGWLEYFAIPLSFIFQIFVFDDDPDPIEGMGATMVMIGCLSPGLHEMLMIVLGVKKERGDGSFYYEVSDSEDAGSFCYALGSESGSYISDYETKSESMSVDEHRSLALV